MHSVGAEVLFWVCMGAFFVTAFVLVIFGIFEITMEQLGKKKQKKDADKPIDMPIPKHMKDKLEKKNKPKK